MQILKLRKHICNVKEHLYALSQLKFQLKPEHLKIQVRWVSENANMSMEYPNL